LSRKFDQKQLQRLIRHTLAALLLIAPLALPPALSYAQLPTLGDGSDMTLGAERKLGERIAREIYRDPDYIDDPLLAEYVQGVWEPLLAAARKRGELNPDIDEHFAWEIMLVRDRTVNAFALPGGYLGVHLGLIGLVASRDELASVLAHELSHVTQRHISRLMSQQSKQTPLMLGAMILGALVAGKSPDAAGALITGGQAVAAQTQLNFSRDMEREADRVGYGVMTQAGFNPQGFVTMFDKLQQASRLNDNGAFPYLRSHPLTTERIADMQARQQMDAKSGTVVALTMEHAMMAARARLLAEPGVDTLRSWVSEADASTFASLGPARQAGVLYAAGLAGVKLRDFAQANGLIARLTALTSADAPAARLTRLLAAEAALAAGDAPRAAALVDGMANREPELLLSAQALIRAGRAGEVVPRLQDRVALHPRDALAWLQLSSAYAAQGQSLRAIRAEAESHAARLDYAAAVDRFKAAQDLMRKAGGGGPGSDYIEASIIDTRTRQLESLLREQAAER
jgi:predicted Zn-dependent protease